jgi:predicted deacylase
MTSASPSRLFPEVDFERDGRQTGFIRLFHSVHASAFGFIPIPIVVIRNGEGPTALFVSGNHGDEYEGQVALCNLARTLDPARIRGRVIILTMANFPAAMAGLRTSPIDGGNLNRSFPGDPDGSITAQIAYFLETVLVPLADVVCDLHSGGSSLMYRPCGLVVAPSDPARLPSLIALLRAFGPPLAFVTIGGNGTGDDHSLAGAAARRGIPCMNTELGGSGSVSAEGLRIAGRGLVNVLVHAGILPAEERIPNEETMRLVRLGGPEYFVYATEKGVFEPLVEPGDMVTTGQMAGRIHRPETPWEPPTAHYFQRDGLVMCKRVPGRTERGDCLFHLGSDMPDGTDRA